jgi:SAM-dependent methyltransferase
VTISDAPAAQRVLERFDLVVNGPALFNAVVAGAELGVFRALSRRPGATAEELRAETGLPAHQLRVLLFALCSTELIHRESGGYANSAVAEDFLATDDEDSWRHVLLGWQRIYYPAFARLTEALRAGTNTALADHPGSEPTLYQRLAHDPETEAVLHASMTAFTLRSLSGLLDHVDLSGTRHVLDVGGGDGTTSRRLAERWPATRFTVFDTPSVTRVAARRTPTGLADRVELRHGDLFDDPFPAGVDCVLFSHCLEIFDADRIVALLRKAHEALVPGGRVLIYGFVASDDEQAGIYSARLSLYLNALASGTGMAYPAGDYERWLAGTGFGDVGTVPGLPYEHALTSGVRA